MQVPWYGSTGYPVDFRGLWGEVKDDDGDGSPGSKRILFGSRIIPEGFWGRGSWL